MNKVHNFLLRLFTENFVSAITSAATTTTASCAQDLITGSASAGSASANRSGMCPVSFFIFFFQLLSTYEDIHKQCIQLHQYYFFQLTQPVNVMQVMTPVSHPMDNTLIR